MHRIRPALLLALLLVPLGAGDPAASRSGPPVSAAAYPAADAAAPAVTRRSLLASERFWPYQVELTRDWKPEGRARALAAGSRAVLIRVEEGGLARLDFGRGGLQRVPVERTDLVARANRVREGRLPKLGPNLAVAIGQRLVDPSGEALRARSLHELRGATAFLCVFADPNSEGLARLARALAALRAQPGLETVLFARGNWSDAALQRRLAELDWSASFVSSHLAQAYTDTLIDADTPLPAVQLQSPEGRILLAGNAAANPSDLARAVALRLAERAPR